MKKEEVAKQRTYSVVKSNKIIQKARYELSAQELKILAYVFSKIKPTDTEFKSYTISVSEFCDICGIDRRNGGNYAYIKNTVKQLVDKSFFLELDDGTITTVSWVNKAWLDARSGRIRIRLDEDLQEYICGLYSNFTTYQLLSTLPMKSAYSFRIFELLKSYSFTGEHTFDVAELKRLLMAEHFVNFKDFRRRVIEIAVKEINLYTDIFVSWEPELLGRKVISIKFSIKQRSDWGIYQASKRAAAEIDGQMNIFDFIHDGSGQQT